MTRIALSAVVALAAGAVAAPVPKPAPNRADDLTAMHAVVTRAVAAGEWPDQSGLNAIAGGINRLLAVAAKAGDFPTAASPVSIAGLRGYGSVANKVTAAHAKAFFVACKSADISHLHDSVVLATGDVKVSHAANCVVITAGDVDISHATNCVVVADGTAKVSHARSVWGPNGRPVAVAPGAGGVFVGGAGLEVSHANGVTCLVTRKPPPGQQKPIRISHATSVLFLNHADYRETSHEAACTTVAVIPPDAK